MSKRILSLAPCLATLGVIMLMSCGKTPQSPYVPKNADVSVYLLDSRGVWSAESLLTEPVGTSIKVGVSPYLSLYIDSVYVTMLEYHPGLDSQIVVKHFSDGDTLWFDFTFTQIKNYTVTVDLFQGGIKRSHTGEILIVGKPVTAEITPPVDSGFVDSLATFSVTPHGDDPFTYQWFHGPTLLAGKTGISFIINQRAISDSGNYTCLVKDKWGDSVVTAPARLVVVPKTTVVTNAKPKILVTGHSTILSFEVCSLFVSVSDPDSGAGDTLKSSIIKAPTGYSYSGSLFTWAPYTGYLGSDSVKTDTAIFMVTDNGKPPMSDTQKVLIVVSAKIFPPDSVKGLAAVSRYDGNFVFKWNKSANADEYAIYRSKDTTGFSQYATTQDTSFTNNIKDTAFYYYVIATNSKKSSPASPRIHSTDINIAPKWSHAAISVSVNEGSSISFDCADSCKDTNGDALSFTLASAGGVMDSLVGTIWKYSPSYSDSGLRTMRIKASDGIDSSIMTLTVHVVNVPRPPQPQAQSLSTKSNSALQITLAAFDPDGDSVTSWVIDTPVTHGTAVLASAPLHTVTYTPTAGFIGTDYFTFKASVGSLSSTYSAKVSIKIDTGNVAPKISQKLTARTLNKGDSLVLTITINPDAFPAPMYYWGKDGAIIDSSTIGSWKKTQLALADSGNYYVIVKNDVGRDSSGARITIQFAPTISTKLAATTTVNEGASTILSVTVNADATPAPAYQWYFNGAAIANAKASSYSKTWAAADAGLYWVTVLNAAGKDSSVTTLVVNVAPVAPSLKSPADGATNQPVALTLLWNKVSIAATYYVQVASDSNFATIFASDSTLTDTSKSLTGCANGATYYWRVRAKNQVGSSPWSGRRSFAIIVASAGAPVLTFPAASATGIPVTTTLTWGAVSGALTYHVQVSTASGFATTIVDDSTLSIASELIGPLANGTQYFWRVNAKNAGGTSGWTTGNFTTIVSVPSAPTLATPANNAINIPLSTSLTWNAATGAVAYGVQVSTASDFSTGMIVDDSTQAPTISKAIVLPSNSTQYYWRVRAKNAGGASSWSSANTFTTVIATSNLPTLGTPLNNATNVPLSATLNWNAALGAATYYVQVSTAADFSSGLIVDDSTQAPTVSKAIVLPSNSTPYFWRVRARNAGGTSAWTTAFTFTTIMAAPPAPTISLPANNASGIALSTTLTWGAATGAATYYVQVSSAVDFLSGMILDDSTQAPTVSKAVVLPSNGTQYYWHVRAKNAGGLSAWTAGTFTTIKKFALTITEANGNVATTVGGNPGTTPFDSGTVVTLTATPATGYHFASWSGGLSGTTNPASITMTGAQSVTAGFAINTFAITATVTGSNGTISPSGVTNVNYNGSQTYTMTPATGYQVATLTVDGSSITPATSYTFSNVTAAHSIVATFSVQTFAITASVTGSNGTISPSGTTNVNYNGNQTYTMTPATGYQVATLTVDGSSITPATSYTFSNVTAAHSIMATFSVQTFAITASVTGSNGTISPSGTTNVNYNGSQTLTISASLGYQVSNVTVDGSPISLTKSYTFSNVTANHSISVSFSTIQWTKVSTYATVMDMMQFNGKLYAASNTDGVLVSSDNGATWSKFYSLLSDSNATSLVAKGNDLYVGLAQGSVMRLVNGSSTWTSVNNLPIDLNVTCMTSCNGYLFAGTSDSGVYYSSNGTDWYQTNAGVNSKYITSLKSIGTTVYYGSSDGVFSKVYNASTWNSTNISGNVVSLSVDGTNLYAMASSDGIYSLPSGGGSWSRVADFTAQTNSLAVSGSSILLAGFNGVVFSPDNGSDQLTITSGITAQGHWFMSIAAFSNGYMFTSNPTGLFRTFAP